MSGMKPMMQTPHIGDLVVAEVLSLGKHVAIEDRSGITTNIFPGDRIIGAFGNRYATDQYEGYVPTGLTNECDLLSVGGVCGEVVSAHTSMSKPNRLKILGMVCDDEGRSLNTRSFGLRERNVIGSAEIILVVGASMNSGKTTTVGTLARALSRGGYRVAAAKVTGTAAGKDGRFFASCGAWPVVDFTDAGYPATYMLGLDELMSIYRTLIGHLQATSPDYILVEIADGIFQRETRMMLESTAFRAGVDHVFFSANDSLSAECGVRNMRAYNLPLRAVTGVFTQSPLALREAEEATNMPCLTINQLVDGGAVAAINAHHAINFELEYAA
jgi:hypothetical protein